MWAQLKSPTNGRNRGANESWAEECSLGMCEEFLKVYWERSQREIADKFARASQLCGSSSRDVLVEVQLRAAIARREKPLPSAGFFDAALNRWGIHGAVRGRRAELDD